MGLAHALFLDSRALLEPAIRKSHDLAHARLADAVAHPDVALSLSDRKANHDIGSPSVVALEDADDEVCAVPRLDCGEWFERARIRGLLEILKITKRDPRRATLWRPPNLRPDQIEQRES